MNDARNALEAALAGLPVDVTHQALQARLDIFDESLILTRFERGQPLSTYEVAPWDVAAAFSGVPITSGLLPRNCLFFAHAGGLERVGIYVPRMVRQLTFKRLNEKHPVTLPLPGLVFVGEGRDYYIYAVKARPTQLADALYVAPFPNTYNGSGRICRGNVSFPPCAVDTIHTALKLFMESEFNGDLPSGKSQAHPYNILDLWAGFEGETWPLDDLKPASRTLGDIMEGHYDRTT